MRKFFSNFSMRKSNNILENTSDPFSVSSYASIDSAPQAESKLLRCCILGAEKTGKTTLLMNYILRKNYSPNQANDTKNFETQYLTVCGHPYRLDIFDFSLKNSEQEERKGIGNARIVIVTFSLEDPSSFEIAKSHVKTIYSQKRYSDLPIFILVGTFADKMESRKVSNHDVNQYIESSCLQYQTPILNYYEINAQIHNSTIDAIFAAPLYFMQYQQKLLDFFSTESSNNQASQSDKEELSSRVANTKAALSLTHLISVVNDLKSSLSKTGCSLANLNGLFGRQCELHYRPVKNDTNENANFKCG